MTELKWEEPPPAARGPLGYEETAQQLKAKPGQWAIVATFPRRSNAGTLSHNIRIGRTAAWQPAGDFEAVSRKVGEEVRVYARYLGEGGQGGE